MYTMCNSLPAKYVTGWGVMQPVSTPKEYISYLKGVEFKAGKLTA